jgi:cytochrome c biogenesis protein CcdA
MDVQTGVDRSRKGVMLHTCRTGVLISSGTFPARRRTGTLDCTAPTASTILVVYTYAYIILIIIIIIIIIMADRDSSLCCG